MLERLTSLERQVRQLADAIVSAAARRQYIDRHILSKVLPAAAGKFGNNEFTVNEFLSHRDLAATAGLNARQLGSLFARSTEQSVDGYQVERIGSDHNAALWRLVWIVELPNMLSTGRSAER